MSNKKNNNLDFLKVFKNNVDVFKQIINNLPIGILIADAARKRVVYGNSKLSEITGYSLDQMKKLDITKIYNKQELTSILKEYKENTAKKSVSSKNIPIVKKDKSIIYCDLNSVVMMFDGLKYIISFFYDVTDRKNIEFELSHRLKFEQSVIEIAQTFAAIIPNEIDSGIKSSLEIIGKLAKVDRCYIYLFANGENIQVNTYWWSKKKLRESKGMPPTIESDQYPWFSKIIKEADTVYLPNIGKLPAECKVEKKYWQKRGIQSLLMIPLIQHNNRIGFIGFESLTDIMYWNKNDISLLSAVSEIVAEALARKWAYAKQEKTAKRLENVLLQIIQVIAQMVETRDPYTAGHQRRVSLLATAIAKELDLSDDEIEGIRLASLIHDIGKMYVPSDLLSRPGDLSEDEFKLIKQHPKIGYNIVKDIEFPKAWKIKELILNHHERLDGSGYPNGKKGEEISLLCQILAVSDVVEAMMSHRPYRPALGLDAAFKEIKKGKGKLFDAKVVNACIRLFKKKGFKFD